MSGRDVAPRWLPPEVRAWAAKHAEVLEAIYAAFERDRRWPAAGALQRELLAGGRRIRLVSTVDDIPPALGNRTHSPDEVRLSLFGLGCVAAARPLLDDYVAVLVLAAGRGMRRGHGHRIAGGGRQERHGRGGQEGDHDASLHDSVSEPSGVRLTHRMWRVGALGASPQTRSPCPRAV